MHFSRAIVLGLIAWMAALFTGCAQGPQVVSRPLEVVRATAAPIPAVAKAPVPPSSQEVKQPVEPVVNLLRPPRMVETKQQLQPLPAIAAAVPAVAKVAPSSPEVKQPVEPVANLLRPPRMAETKQQLQPLRDTVAPVPAAAKIPVPASSPEVKQPIEPVANLLRPWSVAETKQQLQSLVARQDVLTLPPLTVELQPEAERIGPPVDDMKIPISLDAVLRLAQDQNGEVAIAREKLAEAFAEEDVAQKKWIPDLTVGGSVYRHDGGIQDFNGNLVKSHYSSVFGGLEIRGKLDLRNFTYDKLDAARKTWMQRGELSRLTSEKLLEAAGTYIDLLAARSGEAVSGELDKKLTILLEDAKKMEKLDPIAKAEVVRVQNELHAQALIRRKLREGANGAAAKLIYLLGLDPSSELVIMDKAIAPFDLVDVSGPPEKLVAQVLANGPGIQELEGLLALIDDALVRSQGAARYLPAMELSLLEGGFGAGPGTSLRWDNRFDLGLHARWNLTDFIVRREKQQVNLSKVQQAQLTYQDLRAKLILALFEAREVSLSSKEQIQFGRQQIKSAEKSYQLSTERIVGKGKNPTEILLAIRSIAAGQLAYITAIREYDKAQLRLFILVGDAFDPRRHAGVN